MVELAIFGAIFLMILSALLSYGLKYYMTQNAEMRAFRTAMQIASAPNIGTSSYTLIQDRHIPDPMDSFGMGSTAPVTASASVTRTNQMDAMAETITSLSPTIYDIQTNRENGVSDTPQRLFLTGAGWRREYKIPKDPNVLRKYQIIYGSILGKKGAGWEPVDPQGNYSKEDYRPDETCIDGYWTEVGGGEDGPVSVWTCTAYAIDQIRIVDPCVGHIADYNACYDIARKIVDEPYCVTMCQKDCQWDKNPPLCNSNCVAACAAKMRAPNQNPDEKYDKDLGGAWYAADWTCDSGSCDFPVLKRLFNGVKWFGMQPDSESDRIRESSLRKIETDRDITTVESAYRRDRTERTFVKNNNLDDEGYEKVPSSGEPEDFTDHVAPDVYNSFETGSIDQQWTTEKE